MSGNRGNQQNLRVESKGATAVVHMFPRPFMYVSEALLKKAFV